MSGSSWRAPGGLDAVVRKCCRFNLMLSLSRAFLTLADPLNPLQLDHAESRPRRSGEAGARLPGRTGLMSN